MNLLSSSLREQELSLSDFSLPKEYFTNYSFLFYGFELKSKYDEDRLHINKKLNPIKFAHFVQTPKGVEIKYFYGVLPKPNKKFNSLAKKLSFASHKQEFVLSFNNYRHMMSEYEVETENSYGKYSVGGYPFDTLSDLSTTKFNDISMFYEANVPTFQKVAGLTPYVVCDTSNLVKKILGDK